MKKLGKGCLIGAVLRGGASSTSTAQPTAAAISGAAQPVTNPEPTVAPAPTAAPTTYALGQDVQVDEVRWKLIAAADLGTTLKSTNTFIKDKTTSGRREDS
jgi:hypothetical protein